MSRFVEGDGEEFFPNQYALWEANVERALHGRRGRQALADLREALTHLPEKRLISRALCTVAPEARRPVLTAEYEIQEFDALVAQQGEGVCSVGAYIWWMHVKAGMSPGDAFAALATLPDYDEDLTLDDTARAGKAAGLTFPLAWDLALRNDERLRDVSPEGRYALFIDWIDAELAKPA